MSKNSKAQTFWDHADELRSRLLRCLAALVLAAVVFYPFTDAVFNMLIEPVGRIIFTALADAFMAKLQIMLIGAFIIISPYVFYHVWSFICEGLSSKEKDFVKIYGPFSFIFFLAGMCFAHLIAVPFAVKFLLSYGSDRIIPMITVGNYISFVGTMILAFGIIFEMPLVMLFLTKIGIATPAFLMEKRRHAIVGILILSALLTPPDVFSQLLMAVPLLILYEIGIIFSKYAYADQLAENKS